MEYRFLGHTGLKVSVLSLGGWLTYGSQVNKDVTFDCIRTAYELGINFFDTAEVYENGQSEVDMGEAIRRGGWKRSDLVISTKLFLSGTGPNDAGLSRKHIVEGLDASLKRLQMDYVDIVYAHRADPDTPMEETVRAFNHVIDQGKAFYWGTSEWTAEQISEAYGVAARLHLIGPAAEQPLYNMFWRDAVEREYVPLYAKYGMRVAAWSPLSSGLLTGKYNDGIPKGSRLSIPDSFPAQSMRRGLDTEVGRRKLAKVAMLKKIAARLNCTCAQLALAWCVKNPNVATVITGASRPSQLVENVEALKVLPLLTPEVMHEIDGILDNRPVLEPNLRVPSNFWNHPSTRPGN
ncbi:voltage-dependent potassium channel, beta subunit [Thamnocephalis sphaerospora]|uniref:Voltage-dependent potassium channel, beta subunit n=1 Tax=Thamnocephalis sphaerospora TaxID=78915 RepID=A0A4P9XRT1_9FUNG|nr:voltage-dependent potassium channel, beta subunit [Thamnocephalis sphaerospora]|eukprot:RKP08040.1 voltage-dependent potassium channel, beta subunit [Thamnocephalis sphaerospora]